MEAMNLMAAGIEERGSTPAVCLVLGGILWIGASMSQIEEATRDTNVSKASVRDIGHAISTGATAGLTVSATLSAAALLGIRLCATGGIGGVHFGATETGDISADLVQLTRSPVITVCSGAKSVLDIPRTLEYLETQGIPVFAYGSDFFPAFYLRSSRCTARRLDSPKAVVLATRVQWALAPSTGIVVGNPLSESDAVSPADWDVWLDGARHQAKLDRIQGQNVTPYLLSEIARRSEGQTVRANIALLAANAVLAAEIARELGA
jgi:pseudouridine-5'-phosphate glycosidase